MSARARKRTNGLWARFLAPALMLSACDTHCRDTDALLDLVGPDEYVLILTNETGHMVALDVDDEPHGAYCTGVSGLVVGAFPRSACSRITVFFLDNPGTLHLDDCDKADLGGCLANNTDGICYDTRDVNEVEATVD